MARRLDLEETQKCLRAWREFGDEEALTLLTVCNSGLIVFFAKKYLGRGNKVSQCSREQVEALSLIVEDLKELEKLEI